MDRPPEDPVLRSARREAVAAALLFAAAFAYTITFCALRGYDRAPESLTFVLGIPDWVFWGILAPWMVCVAISFIFAFRFMKDETLDD